jgi:hypothetical protein
VTPTTTVVEAPPPIDAGAPDASGPKVMDGGGAGS